MLYIPNKIHTIDKIKLKVGQRNGTFEILTQCKHFLFWYGLHQRLGMFQAKRKHHNKINAPDRRIQDELQYNVILNGTASISITLIDFFSRWFYPESLIYIFSTPTPSLQKKKSIKQSHPTHKGNLTPKFSHKKGKLMDGQDKSFSQSVIEYICTCQYF